MANYISAENNNLGIAISEIVIANLLEANPGSTWQENEQAIINIVSSSNVNDVNIQDKLVCGYSIAAGTIVAENRPNLNTSDFSSMEL